MLDIGTESSNPADLQEAALWLSKNRGFLQGKSSRSLCYCTWNPGKEELSMNWLNSGPCECEELREKTAGYSSYGRERSKFYVLRAPCNCFLSNFRKGRGGGGEVSGNVGKTQCLFFRSQFGLQLKMAKMLLKCSHKHVYVQTKL